MISDKAVEIVKVDIKTLLDKLTKAFVDEWMASYQYWIGAKTARGPLRAQAAAELMQHYTEEMGHAQLIADRIIQLGGSLDMFPQDWQKMGHCKYDAISNTHVVSLLQENLKGEQCAIVFYNDLLKFVENKDVITYNIIAKILADEIEHEQDILQLLEEITA